MISKIVSKVLQVYLESKIETEIPDSPDDLRFFILDFEDTFSGGALGLSKNSFVTTVGTIAHTHTYKNAHDAQTHTHTYYQLWIVRITF